jgi:hypothetical protein
VDVSERPDRRAEREAIAADDARFEALLGRALAVEPASPEARPAARPWRGWLAGAGIAAAVVVGFAAWLGVRDVGAPLPAAVVNHIVHEPASLEPGRPEVPAAEFDELLRRAGGRLDAPVGDVTYAALCPFRGRTVAHFVVRGENGPVTVLLLPHVEVDGPTPIDEEGYSGTLVPMQEGGSIAVVGEPGEPLELIRDRVAAAVRWRV